MGGGGGGEREREREREREGEGEKWLFYKSLTKVHVSARFVNDR